MSAPLVRRAWKRIEQWHRTNDPKLLRELNPGATKKEIRVLEAAIQQPLPDDVRASLSIHNGQPLKCEPFFIGGLRLFTCDDIAGEYSGWRNSRLRNWSTDDRFYRFFPENAIQHHHFNDGWIPILTEDGIGNCLAIDLAPGPTGTVGQVINFGRDIHGPGVLAPGWGAYLTSYADLLDILAEVNQGPADEYYEAFHPMCPANFLDGMVSWARDGRWPIVPFSNSWRTTNVMSLAKMMSKTDDFSAMPILADALEEAGCDSAAVLNHCRDRACKHTNGCWVIDTLVAGNVTQKRWCYDD